MSVATMVAAMASYMSRAVEVHGKDTKALRNGYYSPATGGCLMLGPPPWSKRLKRRKRRARARQR